MELVSNTPAWTFAFMGPASLRFPAKKVNLRKRGVIYVGVFIPTT